MIHKPKPYAAYKDSGVSWLGEVPAHWEVLPNRATFSEVNDRAHPQEQILSVKIAGVLFDKWLTGGSTFGRSDVDKTHTLDDDLSVKTRFDWSTEKNQQLVEQRGISFEHVITAIEQGGLVNVLEHPNQERYPGQLIYVVDIEQYLYLVPFVTEADGSRFLKTIIPSRKATRDYQRRQSS